MRAKMNRCQHQSSAGPPNTTSGNPYRQCEGHGERDGQRKARETSIHSLPPRVERTHAAGFGERQRLAVVAFSILDAACRGDVTGEVEGVSLASPGPQPPGERQGLSGVVGRLLDLRS
jgi:hypothetical protein